MVDALDESFLLFAKVSQTSTQNASVTGTQELATSALDLDIALAEDQSNDPEVVFPLHVVKLQPNDQLKRMSKSLRIKFLL